MYDFTYDNVNRLLAADFNQKKVDNNAGTTSWDHNIVDFSVKMGDGSDYKTAYDANGNILRMQQWGLRLNRSSRIDDLWYTYPSLGNQLQNVIDRDDITHTTTLGDFRTSARHDHIAAKDNPLTDPRSIQDYNYDANGNLIADENKDIQHIDYNVLNLPSTITFKHNQTGGINTINYLYDAAGNKLSKTTTEYKDNGQVITTCTKYIAGFVYESKTYLLESALEKSYNDKLQFTGHEEGRIRYNAVTAAQLEKGMEPTFPFDYFIKDHLGNVRMVLTDEGKEDKYPLATLEDGSIAVEKTFYNIPDGAGVKVKINEIPGHPDDNTTKPNEYTQKLKGDATKVGSSIVLKVMAGDKFNVKVSSWYKIPDGAYPDQPTNPLNDLVAALTGGIVSASAAAGHAVTASALQSSDILSPSISNFLTDPNQFDPASSRPRAYLNWVLLDEQFNYVSSGSGAEQVPDESVYENNTGNAHVFTHVKTDLPITKNGYLYVYVSNETPNTPVFFDNLQVIHYKGVIFDETHYYPFGLTMAGISSKAAGGIENKTKYNGMELQSKEFSDGMGLELYEYKYRFYDQQIGRFISQDRLADKYNYYSPYQFAGNEVPNAIDLDGLEPARVNTSSRVDHTFMENTRQVGNTIVSNPVDVVSQSFTKNYTYYNDDGTTAYTWTQTVTTTATIALDGSVTISQGSTSYFDNPKDNAPMATIPGEGSTPKLSEVSADLRSVVNSVVDYKKQHNESPLQKEARDNIATKEKIDKVEGYAGLGSTVSVPGLVKSGIKGGAIAIGTAMVVGAANTVIDQQMPSNPENITKTTSQKSTTTSYPNGVQIGTPNPKELDKK